MADPTDLRPDEPAPRSPSNPRSRAAGGADLGRRRFFRQFAGELFNGAAGVVGAAQALQQMTAEAAGAILDPESVALRSRRGRAGRPAGTERVPDAVPRDPGRPPPRRPAQAARRPGGVPGPLGVGGRVRDPRDDRARGAGHRPGRRDRADAHRRQGPDDPPVRAAGDAAGRGQDAHRRATHGRQPALGRRAGHGRLRGRRRPVRGRRRDRRRDARRDRHDHLRDDRGPRPPGRRSGWRRSSSRRTGRSGS